MLQSMMRNWSGNAYETSDSQIQRVGKNGSRITAAEPGKTLEYVASAFNGWQAVKIGSQVGWVSGEYSEITTE